MLSDADRKTAADILVAAEKARKQASQLSARWPQMTLEDSYAISKEVADRRMKAGAKLLGYKVGLTSKAMQRSSQTPSRASVPSKPAARATYLI